MIAIVLLNYNGLQHLEKCLRSLTRQTYKGFYIIFVDNASRDGSVEYVKNNFPEVQIIVNNKNLGFSEGNNVGIRQAMENPDVKYVAVLNNDTELKEDWLEQLVAAAEQDKKVGACASKMLYFDQRNIIDSAGDFYFSGSLKVHPRGHGQPDKYFKTEECLSACAGAALYRREALEETRLGNDYFDSDYFAYVEDTDLSLRMRLAGWKCLFVPSAVVYHKVSATTSLWKEDWKKFQTGRNRVFTAIKVYPISKWCKALKNPVTYQKKSSSFIQAVALYCRLLWDVGWYSLRMLEKRNQIKRFRSVDANIFEEWEEKFSTAE
ncbi:MAG: glycosyltransferase family 2 protein [Patescibacteria group bacterium]